MAVIGLEVPHAHVHLIPISEMHQMTFQTKVKLSENEFAALAEKITAEL
jgi:histidine triad (HIT) family protein